MTTQMDPPFNVLDGPLRPCSHEPVTGWFRDGCCNTNDADRGSHTVCAVVTTRFLEFLRASGNNLMTPAPQHGFPGLVEGNQWCVCAASWRRAAEQGAGCPVHLEGTHKRALEVVPLELLLKHAVAAEA